MNMNIVNVNVNNAYATVSVSKFIVFVAIATCSLIREGICAQHVFDEVPLFGEFPDLHHKLNYDRDAVHNKHVDVRKTPGKALEFTIHYFERIFELVLFPDDDVISSYSSLKNNIHHDTFYDGKVKGENNSLVYGGLHEGMFIGTIHVNNEEYTVDHAMGKYADPVHSVVYNVQHDNYTLEQDDEDDLVSDLFLHRMKRDSSSDKKPKGPLKRDPSSDEKPKGPLKSDPSSDKKPKGPLKPDPSSDKKPKGPLKPDPSSDKKPKGPLKRDPSSDKKPKGPLKRDPSSDKKPKRPLKPDPSSDKKPAGPLKPDPSSNKKPKELLKLDSSSDEKPKGPFKQGIVEGNVECPIFVAFDHSSALCFREKMKNDDKILAFISKRLGAYMQFFNKVVKASLEARHQKIAWTISGVQMHTPEQCRFVGRRGFNKDAINYNLCGQQTVNTVISRYAETKWANPDNCLTAIFMCRRQSSSTTGTAFRPSFLHNRAGMCAERLLQEGKLIKKEATNTYAEGSRYDKVQNTASISMSKGNKIRTNTGIRRTFVHVLLHGLSCEHASTCKDIKNDPFKGSIMGQKPQEHFVSWTIGGCCAKYITDFLDATITGQFGRKNCLKPKCDLDCMNGGKCTVEGYCECSEGYRGGRCELATADEGSTTKYGCAPKCANGVCKWGHCQCTVGWSGAICSTPVCHEICANGGTCSEPGTCKCLSGWGGDTCKRAKCTMLCMNKGYCVGPNKCRCKPGYVGNTCNNPVCHCSNGGICVRPELCKCPVNWKGPHCIDVGGCNPECIKGFCVGGKYCQCEPGYGGVNCNLAICLPECKHGLCTGPNTCTCAAGHEGSLCEKGTCKDACVNGGECNKETALCSCPDVWTGKTCDKAVCVPACRNGGLCVNPNTCKCLGVYVGIVCEEYKVLAATKDPSCKKPSSDDSNNATSNDSNNATSNDSNNETESYPPGLSSDNLSNDDSCEPPCKNEGACANNRCFCPGGYSGSKCQFPKCLQTCVTGVCIFPNTCLCKKGYKGEDCGTAICSPECENEGECTAPGTCSCAPGYGGLICQDMECEPGCENGGSCTGHPNNCTCTEGWEGQSCADSVCVPPCGDQGNCTGPNACTCIIGYSGKECEFALCSVECQNGGKCMEPDICNCTALEFFEGDYCEIMICKPPCSETRGICIKGNVCLCRYPWSGKTCTETVTTAGPVVRFTDARQAGSFGAHCGNQVIEQVEECDCGPVETCQESCCYGAGTGDGKDCTLKPLANCTFSEGCCRKDCTIEPDNWFVCLEETACTLPALCDGSRSSCPPSENKRDGTFCGPGGSTSQTCQGGNCVSVCKLIAWLPCYNPVKVDLDKVSDTDTFCYVACKDPAGGECISTKDIDLKKRAPVLFNMIGSHDRNHHDFQPIRRAYGEKCHDSLYSYCDILNKCRLKSGFGPQNFQMDDSEVPMKDVYGNFTEPVIQQMKDWIHDKWWTFLLITSIIIGLTFVFMLFLVRSTPPYQRPDIKIPKINNVFSKGIKKPKIKKSEGIEEQEIT